MKIAIPIFGSRVSPRCMFASDMIVARIKHGKVQSSDLCAVEGMSEEIFLDQLVDLNVNVFICGGAGKEFIEEAEASGIRVINNVAGEVDDVLKAYIDGTLAPGFGISEKIEIKRPAERHIEPGEVNCISCKSRRCLRGEDCHMEAPSDPDQEDERERHIHEVALDVAWEQEEKMCRVAEVVHFAVGMGYKKVGLAFCVEMFKEAEILTGVLERFFEVVPVSCRIGAQGPPEHSHPHGGHADSCNSIGQAMALNAAGTDLNLVIGLCVGCDILFTEHSDAPCTTLFVKDKSLANNPVGALYSRYYLSDILRDPDKKETRY